MENTAAVNSLTPFTLTIFLVFLVLLAFAFKDKGFIKNTLGNSEQIIYHAKVSLWSLSFYIFLGVILFFSDIFLGLIFILIAALKYITTEIAITNKKVVAKTGLIKRKMIEIRLEKIESLQVEQGIFGRILNFGSIVVSGAGTPQAAIPNISKPLEYRNEFRKLTDKD